MFIYYEMFPSSLLDKSDLVTEIVISSNGRDSQVNWKNKQEKATLEFCTHLFKQVPVANWTFSDLTKVWTFIGYTGDVIITGLHSMKTQGMLANCEIKLITDLSAKVVVSRLDKRDLVEKVIPQGQPKYTVDDFFYNPHATASVEGLSGQALVTKISVLLGVSVEFLNTETDDSKLKKLYRQAALRLHPDRNNGDGSKMSELNMLWNLFNQRV